VEKKWDFGGIVNKSWLPSKRRDWWRDIISLLGVQKKGERVDKIIR
jgi:hypothetical protein